MRTPILGTAAAILMTLCVGCKEDPPPPPPPSADTAAAPTGSASQAAARDRSKVPRISAETMKQFRVETCYFGSMGLMLARDAYLASLGGKGPSQGNLPSFGDYPENRPSSPPDKEGAKDETEAAKKDPAKDPLAAAKAKRQLSRRPMAGGGRTLPFIRHVRACSIAKSLKTPAYPELDKAIGEFEGTSNTLQKLFLDATRYYAREQFKKDDFKRAKQMDESLKEALPKLDDAIAKFGEAYRAWQPTAKQGDEKLDDSGKISLEAMNAARKVTLAVLAPERDAAAIEEGMKVIKGAHATLEKTLEADRTQPHARVMVPRLKAFTAAVEGLGEVEGELTSEQLYPVTSQMANVVEAHQRGLAQMLRRSKTGDRALRIRPKVGPDRLRMMPLPGNSADPKLRKPITPKITPK